MLHLLSSFFFKKARTKCMRKILVDVRSVRRVASCTKTNSLLSSSSNNQNCGQSLSGNDLLSRRLYSNNSKSSKFALMDFQMIIWPTFIRTIKNWMYSAFIVRPHLDPDFSLKEFLEGSKYAAIVVSNSLAEGNMDQLRGLLTPECLSEVQKNVATLSAKQRHELTIKKNDIYFSFPYELGILFNRGVDSDTIPQKREVEITVVHHVLRGHSDMVDRGEPVPLNLGMLPEYRDRIFVLNYRFIRNYTKDVSDQWTINVVNHFKPDEHGLKH